MRAREFIKENSGTCSSSIAPVSTPIGGIVSRAGSSDPAKYMNSFIPVKRKKRNARG